MRYWMFLLVVSFCLSSAMAADAEVTNEKAQSLLARVGDFVEDHSADMGDYYDPTYMDTLTSIASTIPEDAERDNFDVNAFMNAIENNTDNMVGQLNGNASLKADYLNEVVNYFVKGYCEDMKNDVLDIDTETYVNDLQKLNTNYQSLLEDAEASQSQSPSSTGIGYNPENYLDEAAGATKRNTEFDFKWGGIQSSWLGYNMVALVQAFQQKFSHDAIATNDFQFLMDLWPQSAEAYLMNTAYDSNMYYINNENDPSARESSYVVNEYGSPTSEFEEDEFDVGSNSTRYITATYNNRQWGYSDGTYDLVTITTNGRKYSLAENFYTSPLVLDLDGDQQITASNGKWLPHSYEQDSRLVEFDMNGDGFVELCEWVGPEDGLLLVYDEAKDTVNGNDLFGNAGGYDHGYEELLLFDANNDNAISGDELDNLSVWCDLDSDAQVDDGEIQAVADMGITLISLNYDQNVVSHFMQDGEQKMMFDWFPSMFSIRRTE